METPTLSKAQQKRSLSSIKGKRITIKNVIATPYTTYWPLVNEEDCKVITDALEEHLKLLKPQVKVPWNVMKDVPREQHKEFRLKYRNSIVSIDPDAKSGVIVGVNNITKNLERNSISAVLISNEVNPRLMVRHVIDMSVECDTPVLIIPNLKEILKNKLGIKGVAMGLKKKLNSNYEILRDIIKTVYANYPLPGNHITVQRKDFLKQQEIIQKSKEENKRNKGDFNICTRIPRCIDTSIIEGDIEALKYYASYSDPYLYRTNNKTRVFVPENGNKNETNSMEFIEIETDNSSQEEKEPKVDSVNQNSSHYQHLTIKRIQSNRKRKQKKSRNVQNN